MSLDEPLRILGAEWDAISDPDAWISYERAAELMGYLEERVPDAFLIRAALHATGADFGMLHYLWASSGTYLEGFEAVRRFHSVASTAGDLGQFSLHPEEDRTAVRVSSGDASPFVMGSLFLNLVVANTPTGALDPACAAGREHLVSSLGGHTGEPFLIPRVIEARFAHPAPPFADQYRTIFVADERLTFDSPHFELVFATESLTLPRRSADQHLHRLLARDAGERIERINDDNRWTRRTEQALMEALGTQPVTAQHIAASLGVSESTLSRRLSEEGQSFKKALDSLRCEQAQRHLQRRDLSIQEIAYLLGYSNLGAFHRAFRRWKGLAPGQYRREQRRASSPPLR